MVFDSFVPLTFNLDFGSNNEHDMFKNGTVLMSGINCETSRLNPGHFYPTAYYFLWIHTYKRIVHIDKIYVAQFKHKISSYKNPRRARKYVQRGRKMNATCISQTNQLFPNLKNIKNWSKRKICSKMPEQQEEISATLSKWMVFTSSAFTLYAWTRCDLITVRKSAYRLSLILFPKNNVTISSCHGDSY